MIILKNYIKNSESKTGLRIGVLASNPELYSNKRIMEAGEMRGHEMHFLNIKECYVLMLKHRKSTIEAESF
jgi:ribosomal protein S6--L-glutamate ligase